MIPSTYFSRATSISSAPRPALGAYPRLAGAVCAVAATLLVGAPTAIAQTEQAVAAPAGPPLTLDQAVSQACERSTDIAVAKARLAEAIATRGKAGTAFLPNIQAVGSYTHNSVEASFDSGALITGVATAIGMQLQGKPIPIPASQLPAPSTIQKQDTIGGVLQLDETVFAISPWLAAQSADKAVNAQQITVEAVRREMAFQVAQIFYTVAGIERLIQVAEKAVALADQRIANAQNRRAAGADGEVSVLRAQSERDKAEQDLVRSKQSRAQLLIALATLTDSEAPAQLAPPPPLTMPVGDAARWVEDGFGERADLKARRVGVDAAAVAVREAQLRWLPMVTVQALGRYTDTPGFIGKNWLWAVTANLVVPLFDRGLRYAEAEERTAQKRRMSLELSKAELDLRAGIRQNELDIATGRRTLAVAESSAQKAKRTAEIVARAQAAGGATSLEVAEADTNLRVAEASVEREKILLDLAILRLRHWTGAVRAP